MLTAINHAIKTVAKVAKTDNIVVPTAHKMLTARLLALRPNRVSKPAMIFGPKYAIV